MIITSPAMVSKEFAESMVIKRKLLPCTILIERIESPEGTPMICCAVDTLLQPIKKRIIFNILWENLLIVNFNRNGSVFVRAVNWDFYFIREW